VRVSTRPSTYKQRYKQDAKAVLRERSTRCPASHLGDVLREQITDLRRTNTYLHPSIFLAVPRHVHDPTTDIPMEIHIHRLADARTRPLERAHLADQGYNGW